MDASVFMEQGITTMASILTDPLAIGAYMLSSSKYSICPSLASSRFSSANMMSVSEPLSISPASSFMIESPSPVMDR